MNDSAERLRTLIGHARRRGEGSAVLSRATLPVADVVAVLDELEAREADDARRSDEGRTDWDYEARLAAVVALHVKESGVWDICRYDDESWPCETVRLCEKAGPDD